MFTAVGDLRASIGPPIIIMEAGVSSPAEAINEDDAIPPVVSKDSISPATSVQNNIKVPATGTRVDQLPPGARTVVIKNEKYYLSPTGVYYQVVIEGDKVRYEVTGNSEAEK